MFFLLLCLLFGNLRFEAIDDFFMAAQLSGAIGSDYDPHLIFVNAIYGYALLPLYHFFPKINWYYIGEIASVFVSLSTISFIIISRLKGYWGILISTIVIFFLSNDLYLGLQFTQCAAVLAAAGMGLFLDSIIKKYESIKMFNASLCLAILLVLWGALMRWQAYLMGLPLFFFSLLIGARYWWANKKMVFVGVVALLMATFGAREIDRSLYDNQDYAEFNAFQGPRVAVGDAVEYDKNAVLEDAEEFGLSDDDFFMLTDWMFYDPKVFSPDSIRLYSRIIQNYWDEHPAQTIPSYLLLKLSNSLNYPIFWIWCLGCVLVFFFNKKNHVYIWGALCYVFSMFAYLLFVGRHVYRVEIGIWLYAVAMALPLLKQFKMQMHQKIFGVLFSVIIFSSVMDYYCNADWVRDPSSGVKRSTVSTDTTNYEQVLEYIDTHQEDLFLVDMITYMRLSRHLNPPYLTEPKGRFKRIISFGYWTPYLPEVKKNLSKFGVENPLRDVVKEHVQVVNAGGLKGYLERHHYKEVSVEKIHTIGGVSFFKYELANSEQQKEPIVCKNVPEIPLEKE